MDLIGACATTDSVSSCSMRKAVPERQPCWGKQILTFTDASNTGRLY